MLVATTILDAQRYYGPRETVVFATFGSSSAAPAH
jgi:hypothetical protein